NGSPVESNLEAGRSVLRVDPELDLREALFQVGRSIAGNFLPVPFVARAREGTGFAKERPRACGLAHAIIAIGKPQQRAERRIELLATFELLARLDVLFFGHERRRLLKESFRGRALVVGWIGFGPRDRQGDASADDDGSGDFPATMMSPF